MKEKIGTLFAAAEAQLERLEPEIHPDVPERDRIIIERLGFAQYFGLGIVGTTFLYLTGVAVTYIL